MNNPYNEDDDYLRYKLTNKKARQGIEIALSNRCDQCGGRFNSYDFCDRCDEDE